MAGLLVAAVVVALISGGPTTGATSPVVRVGDVPESLWSLALPSPQGEPVAMESMRGRPVVVNFWATWCAPCVKEMPDLDRLQREHPHVQFVGIGIDSAANIRTFLQKIPVAYPLMVFETGGTSALRRLGNSTGGLPYTLVLDARGRVAHTILGQVDPAALAAQLAIQLPAQLPVHMPKSDRP